jgi:hypothetical protein
VEDPEGGEGREQVHRGVFVTARYPSGDRLTFRVHDGSEWKWGPDLGAPGAGAEFVGGPVAYSFQFEGLRISAFVVARAGRGAPYRLYERSLLLPGRSAAARVEAWKDYGVPRDAQGKPCWSEDRPFRMSTCCLFWQGNQLRCILLGEVEGDGVAPARLIEHSYANQRWAWGEVRAVPDGGDFRTESSAVVRRGDASVRVSVLGRSSSGRIWEHASIQRRGGEAPWFWVPLSP